jgi:hypothetical protein
MMLAHTNTQRGVWYGSQGPQRIVIRRSLAEHSSRLVPFSTNPKRSKRNPATAQANAGLRGAASASVSLSADYLAPADPAAVEGACGHEPPATNTQRQPGYSRPARVAPNAIKFGALNSRASASARPVSGLPATAQMGSPAVTAGETAPFIHCTGGNRHETRDCAAGEGPARHSRFNACHAKHLDTPAQAGPIRGGCSADPIQVMLCARAIGRWSPRRDDKATSGPAPIPWSPPGRGINEDLGPSLPAACSAHFHTIHSSGGGPGNLKASHRGMARDRATCSGTATRFNLARVA